MTSRTDHGAPGSVMATHGKVEYQFRGSPYALKRLREALDDAGVFVQVDHEFRNDVWDDDSIVFGALMVPVAERADTPL